MLKLGLKIPGDSPYHRLSLTQSCCFKLSVCSDSEIAAVRKVGAFVGDTPSEIKFRRIVVGMNCRLYLFNNLCR